jgi:8-oxo-(d)GTP phosphatase
MVAMKVLLVRHGHAGTKEAWREDDRIRPLSPKGEHQAQWLADVLVPYAPDRIISSPYLRCLQTVAPLAEKIDVPVVHRDQLVPDAGSRALSYLQRLGRSERDGPVVVCTHGEVIGAALGALAAKASVKLERKPPGHKGGLWALDMRSGKLRSVTYLPPP